MSIPKIDLNSFLSSKSDIADIPSIAEAIAAQQVSCMDKVILQVMTQALSREPTPADYKDFQLIDHVRFPDVQFFAYKGKLLGRLKWTYDYSIVKNTITYSFEPCDTITDKPDTKEQLIE